MPKLKSKSYFYLEGYIDTGKELIPKTVYDTVIDHYWEQFIRNTDLHEVLFKSRSGQYRVIDVKDKLINGLCQVIFSKSLIRDQMKKEDSVWSYNSVVEIYAELIKNFIKYPATRICVMHDVGENYAGPE